ANISSGEIGRITKSNNYGVYGNYSINVNDKELIQLSNKNDVKLQEAYIYTVLYGTTVEKFTIQILEIYPNSPSKEKGITFRITDKRLLELTGGIIQGMSGSPVVQNGRIVGAVTHVLVNDPTRGYGIFIENMLEAAK
ncbi:MAG: SpoIVB peptidase, partial [Oscillospiraceae bacterium]|nr:SpoIVB peptidase [Oscillospiraceae bacterium]